MPYFSMSDELKVGNSFIDNDHQKLIDLLNQLHNAMAQGHGKEVVGKILNELIRYTHEHFKREEEHMQKIRYADFKQHQAEHDKLLKDVLELQTKFHSGNGMLSVQVFSFLRNWLVQHIMGTDKKLALAMRQAATIQPG